MLLRKRGESERGGESEWKIGRERVRGKRERKSERGWERQREIVRKRNRKRERESVCVCLKKCERKTKRVRE